jgi:hypothetical protein
MERRIFIKDSMLTGLSLSVPGIIMDMSFDKMISPFLKIVPDLLTPQFSFFAIDSLGKNNLNTNIILYDDMKQVYATSVRNNEISYRLASQTIDELPVWEVSVKRSSFTLHTNFDATHQQSFLFNIEQHANHATLLGMIDGTFPGKMC